jgi:transcriptional regulator with XRE-family HTH domain
MADVDIAVLYDALDAQRRARDLSWRQLAGEAGVSPSTLTRMAQGRHPDLDGFASLTKWLGVPAERFIGSGDPPPTDQAEPAAYVLSYLRARRDISPKNAKALSEIVQAAYERLRDT